MYVDWVLTVIGVLWVLGASISDLRTKEVPDWLSFSLISLGFGIRLLHSLIFSDWPYFLFGVLGFAVAFIIGVGFYYSHIWGGGDAKLLMGLGVVFATSPFAVVSSLPFFIVILANILIFGAIYGMVWSVLLFFENYSKVSKFMYKLFKESAKLRYAVLAVSILLIAASAFMQSRFGMILTIVLSFSLTVYYFLFIFIRAIESIAMYRKMPVSRLVLGDWVAEEVKVRGKVICSPSDFGLNKKQLALLAKSKVKSVLIKDGMAFVPTFLLGLLFSLIFGNVLLFGF